MSCLTQHTSDENLTVMRGETLVGDFVVKDDYGRRVASVDGITLILTDLDNKIASPVLILTDEDGIEFDRGRFKFVLSPETTSTLPLHVGLEIKITIGGIVRIAANKFVTMVDNKVKDY